MLKRMEVRIDRTYHHEQTTGRLYVFDDNNGVAFDCDTLELKWNDNARRISCIPEGSYTCVHHFSPTFGECFWIKDVPHRSEVLIHTGNYAGSQNPKTLRPDTLGCILVGNGLIDISGDGIVDVVNSRVTMDSLIQVLPDVFTLNITRSAS